MANIFITGATGNIGVEVIRFLHKKNSSHKVIVGIRDTEKAKIRFKNYPDLGYVPFDFEDSATFYKVFTGIDRVFLLRPPHISDIETFFRPLVLAMKEKGVREVVFLSVQGAETSKVIPHNKIERLLREAGVDYIFLRPSYFMQNLTTTLLPGIQQKREILLPAGKAKFNWIDIENIGEAAAILLEKFDEYRNQIFEITGMENEHFGRVTAMINAEIASPIAYRNVNPISFYFLKKREGVPSGLIIVMLLLHFLPRFQKEPRISGFYEQVTGKKPTSLAEFIAREKGKFEKQ